MLRLSVHLLGAIASWLSHLDNAQLARTCTQWRAAAASRMAHETLDLRRCTAIHPGSGLPQWCRVLLDMPRTQWWRSIRMPELGNRTFVLSRTTDAADRVLVRLLKRAESVDGLWCSFHLLHLLAKEAARIGTDVAPALKTAHIVAMLELTDPEHPVSEQQTAFADKLQFWLRFCPQLTRAELRWCGQSRIVPVNEKEKEGDASAGDMAHWPVIALQCNVGTQDKVARCCVML